MAHRDHVTHAGACPPLLPRDVSLRRHRSSFLWLLPLAKIFNAAFWQYFPRVWSFQRSRLPLTVCSAAWLSLPLFVGSGLSKNTNWCEMVRFGSYCWTVRRRTPTYHAMHWQLWPRVGNISAVTICLRVPLSRQRPHECGSEAVVFIHCLMWHLRSAAFDFSVWIPSCGFARVRDCGASLQWECLGHRRMARRDSFYRRRSFAAWWEWMGHFCCYAVLCVQDMTTTTTKYNFFMDSSWGSLGVVDCHTVHTESNTSIILACTVFKLS